MLKRRRDRRVMIGRAPPADLRPRGAALASRPAAASRRARALLALVVALLGGGCVRERLYRPESVVHTDAYDLAFIEVDDQGELWSFPQVLAADQLIRDAGAAPNGVILNVFIHGWQHNASPKDENVAGFESLLTQIDGLERTRAGPSARRTLGVYIGWRGKAARLRLLAPFTFFSRMRSARRVAGTPLTETLFRLLLAGRSNANNTTVVMGHSFGGLVLETALSQAFIGALSSALAQDLREVRFPADLVLLINPASQAIQAKQLIDILGRHHLKFQRTDAEGRVYDVPLVVSMTSTADLATRGLFPVGMRFKGIGNEFRPYGPESCGRGRQADYFRHTAGHERALHSHLVDVEPLDAVAQADLTNVDSAILRIGYRYDPVTRMQTWIGDGEKLRYEIHQNPRSWNDTPYWIMEVPPAILPDHSRIFGRETIEFAGTLIAMTGALEGSDRRARLVRDDRVKPVVLATRADGEVSFLDRSQRIFSIDRVTSEPKFVSCLPDELTDVEDVLGVGGTGEEAWIAGTLRGFGKKAAETRIGINRLGVKNRKVEEVGRSLPPEVTAAAAAFDLSGERLFLARLDRPGIDVVDLSGKKLEAAPLLDLESPEPLRMLAYDGERRRLFGSDGKASLIVVDLEATPPSVTTLAGDLALPSALAYDGSRHRLYVTTAGDGVLWKLDCASACGAPERMAAAREISHPRALAVDAEGTVWVGDLEHGILAGVSPDGEVSKRIERLPEG
jgi:hypothetical protein